jgi:hypothetical protein
LTSDQAGCYPGQVASQCVEIDCETPVRSRGRCNKHYLRYLNAGGDRGYPSEEERFWASVDCDGPVPVLHPEAGPCWIWTGKARRNGYGLFNRSRDHGPNRVVLAHRMAWFLLYDEWPHDPATGESLTISHFACSNHPCVNAWSHLLPETLLDNIRRDSPNGTKTHCVHGHPFTPENTRITPEGWRKCRRCHSNRVQGRPVGA